MKHTISLAALLLFTSLLQAQSSKFTLLKSFQIQSGGGWDYINVSPTSPNLYVSHGSQVNILNKNTGDSVGVIDGTIGVHGIVFAPHFEKGFISCGKLAKVFVFNATTNQVTDSIPTGENPDAMCYDNFTKRLAVGNGRSKSASIIDAATNKVLATIPLGGKPEASVSNEAGKVFINIEDKNEVAVIDIQDMKVIARYPLPGGEEPAGLAIDLKASVLFVGCSGNNKLFVLDSKTGKQLALLPIGHHNDALAFDPLSGTAFASNGDGTLTVVKAVNGTYKVTETVPTKRGARTLTLDKETQLLYLPTADFELQPANSKQRPAMIPGTFKVLVVGHKN